MAALSRTWSSEMRSSHPSQSLPPQKGHCIRAPRLRRNLNIGCLCVTSVVDREAPVSVNPALAHERRNTSIAANDPDSSRVNPAVSATNVITRGTYGHRQIRKAWRFAPPSAASWRDGTTVGHRGSAKPVDDVDDTARPAAPTRGPTTPAQSDNSVAAGARRRCADTLTPHGSSSAAALSTGRARCEPESGGDSLSGARTSADRTQDEAREWERNRVAWNLPREVRAAPSNPLREAPTESDELGDSTGGTAEDG